MSSEPDGADLDYKDQMRLGEAESALGKARQKPALSPVRVDLKHSPPHQNEDTTLADGSKAPSPFHDSQDDRTFELDRQHNSMHEPLGQSLEIQ